MAKKRPKKSSKKLKSSIEANIEVGGNIGGNIIVGDSNIINMATLEQVSLRALHQLPQPPADFTGRETVIDQLLKKFESHKGSTISGLTGMGGIGKTTLGLIVAHKLSEKYPDAQIFLDLKGTTEPLSALEIARHIIFSFEPTADLRALDDANLFAAYQSVLHGKKALLFFDNARSAKQIAYLRPPDSCAMLVTSRWTFSMPGLQSQRVDMMTEEDAINFLLELCPRIDRRAADLAKACAYLPLALRVAGSFLQVNNHWSIENYLSQLNDRKQRLETLKQNRQAAELTAEPDLLATFELSYNQLSEESQRRWRILGVFPTSFELSAAKAIWKFEEEETRNLLGLLRRYSLLEFDENSSRYSLHDLLADYALAQLESGEEQESRIKHASHYMEVMWATDSLYEQGGDSMSQGLHLFDLEWEHVRIAQAWIAGNIEASEQIADLAMQYPDASVYCLDLRLHPRQKIEWLKLAIKASQELENKKYEGIHIGELGLAYAALGDAHTAIEFYEQALVIDREIGNRRGEGNVLGNIGVAYSNLGDARKAIEFHEQALLISREIGDRRGEASDLGNLGVAYADLGDRHKAIEFYEQALVIDREIGNRLGQGSALGNLGLAYSDLGNTRKAIKFYEQAIIIAREIGDRRNESNWLSSLGVAYSDLGERHKAIEFYEQALVIDREIGNRRGEASDLGNLGVAYAELGNLDKAIKFYEKQLVIVRETGDRRGEGNALFNMGLDLYSLKEKAKAIDLVKQALEIREAIESPLIEKTRHKLKEWGAL